MKKTGFFVGVILSFFAVSAQSEEGCADVFGSAQSIYVWRYDNESMRTIASLVDGKKQYVKNVKHPVVVSGLGGGDDSYSVTSGYKPLSILPVGTRILWTTPDDCECECKKVRADPSAGYDDPHFTCTEL